MFLFSGLLGPVPARPLLPAPVPVSDPVDGAGEVETLRSVLLDILDHTSDPRAHPGLLESADLLVDRSGRGFVILDIRRGCLVTRSDPVMRDGAAGESELVEDVVELAGAGGRVPVFRNVSPEKLELYDDAGLVVRRTGLVEAVDLARLDSRALALSPLGRIEATLLQLGMTLEVVPPEWVGMLEEELLDVADWDGGPEGRRSPVAVLRSATGPAAWAALVPSGIGGEIRCDTIWTGLDSPSGSADALLAGVARWVRSRGAPRLLVQDLLDGEDLPFQGRVRTSLPVSSVGRFTARPGGIGGAWAEFAAVRGSGAAGSVH